MGPNTSESTTDTSKLRFIKGIGPKRAKSLEKLGIQSIKDLFFIFPRRYEDRSSFKQIADAKFGEYVTLRGEILKVTLRRILRMTLVEVTLGDDSGMIYGVWFNQPYLKNYFVEGREMIFYGRVDLYKNRLQITSPEYEIVDPAEDLAAEAEAENRPAAASLPPHPHTGRITPIYPLSEGLSQRAMRLILYQLVQNQLASSVQEWMPEAFLQENHLMRLQEAIREMHFPSGWETQIQARRRVVFDEFFLFEMALIKKIETLKKNFQSYSLHDGQRLYEAFKKSLPFELTQGQQNAIADLLQDLPRLYPMNRLLQGDVGSGKTVIAAFAMLLAAKNQCQSALLVPTEILAEQHFRTLKSLLQPFDINLQLLTSSTPEPKRDRLLAELKQGKIPAIVGTHALLSEDVLFQKLALVIVDEQHKFGVHQRTRLLQRNPRPHQLVMTATPIPRTLALTIYGDLEVSVIKELPAGRQPIKTYWITRQKQRELLQHILEKIKSGDQAYFIFPVIEETEKSDLLAAKKEFQRLKEGVFRSIPLGLVHGKVSHEEQESIMKGFAAGDIKVLVATSVIEVGVNNPNATLMVVENAERFGLSQLHQMRGRIGRGHKPSECFLFGEPKTIEGQKRLRIMTKTQNGFLIAEEDLKLRGPGDFWGTRQSGEAFFRVGNPILDQELLFLARDKAQRIYQTRAWEEAPAWKIARQFLEHQTLQY